jgi:transitional endoplasmic reticulum ATPase
MEPFNIIEKVESPTAHGGGPYHLFDDVVRLGSAKTADHDLQYIVALREAHPGMIITAVPATNVSLKYFAMAGFASMEVDSETDSYASWRGYVPPQTRAQQGALGEAVSFAKYRYKWAGEDVSIHCPIYTFGIHLLTKVPSSSSTALMSIFSTY